ncbi:MAG: GAF domain-containing protein [Balneolaceae bacterium]|nr:GAF domain-containing protein [Balneolaceae bacterium]
MELVNSQIQKSDEKLSILLDLISQINSNLDLDSVLLNIIEGAKTITNSEACSVYLIESGNGELTLTLPTGPLKESLSGKKIPAGEGIAGWVAKHGEAQIVNNVAEDHRFRGDFEPHAFQTRNMICVPLSNQSSQIIGVLQAINRIDEKSFSNDDIPFFQALANQAAIAIDNARLNEERKNLLSEIHHRVKNNMALISGLMQIQSFNEENPGIRSKLLDNVVRISTMATVHEYFYSSSSFSTLNFTETIRMVVQKGIQTLEPEADISTTFQCDEVMLNINQAIPCSLLISEFLIHTIKHGLENRQTGHIEFRLKENQNDQSITIKITDDGESVMNYILPDKEQTPEISLLRTFSGQIEAKYQYESNNGQNTISINFTKTDKTGGANHSLK